MKIFKPRMFVVYREEDIENFRQVVEKAGAIWDGSHRIMFLNVWNQQAAFHQWACIYHFYEDLDMELLC
jgi:hypothetical protein